MCNPRTVTQNGITLLSTIEKWLIHHVQKSTRIVSEAESEAQLTVPMVLSEDKGIPIQAFNVAFTFSQIHFFSNQSLLRVQYVLM